MSFTKIKYGKTGVALEWLTQEGPKRADNHEHRFTSFESPHPDFVNALAAFVTPVLELLELPEDYQQGLLVSGVSVTYEDERGRGLVVTLQKQLEGSSAPLIFNTPYLPEDGGEHSPSLPTEMLVALDGLIEEATEFLTGKRAQGSLFAEDDGKAAVRAAAEKLRPKKGSGIESVTISAMGKSVTLTPNETVAH